MITFLIGLMTVALLISCVLLIFLVLIQLPKKEAGAGLAFGGAATDALFGAGSGNALTKITKYVTVAFLTSAFILSLLYSQRAKRGGSSTFEEALKKQQGKGAAPIVVPPTQTNIILSTPAGTNAPAAATNQLTLPATNLNLRLQTPQNAAPANQQNPAQGNQQQQTPPPNPAPPTK